MATLADRVREARVKKGLTQEGLADALGLSRPTITQYESGRREPDTVELLRRLAELLEVSVDWLAGRTDDPTPPQRPGEDPSVRAIFRASQNLTPEEMRSVLDFIEFMRSRRGGGSDNQAAPKRGPGP